MVRIPPLHSMLNSGIEQKAILRSFGDFEMSKHVRACPNVAMGDFDYGVLNGGLGIRRGALPFPFYT